MRATLQTAVAVHPGRPEHNGIRGEEFEARLARKSEEEVFGPDAPPSGGTPTPRALAAEGAGEAGASRAGTRGPGPAAGPSSS